MIQQQQQQRRQVTADPQQLSSSRGVGYLAYLAPTYQNLPIIGSEYSQQPTSEYVDEQVDECSLFLALRISRYILWAIQHIPLSTYLYLFIYIVIAPRLALLALLSGGKKTMRRWLRLARIRHQTSCASNNCTVNWLFLHIHTYLLFIHRNIIKYTSIYMYVRSACYTLYMLLLLLLLKRPPHCAFKTQSGLSD